MMGLVQGWGRYPRQQAMLHRPHSLSQCRAVLAEGQVTPRGMGRSYGDSAIGPLVLQTDGLDYFRAYDRQNGLLTCQAGVLLRDILALTVPDGWFLPVTPGTGFVTVGGAIASDVHGKNHHGAGTFSQHVVSLDVMLASGDVLTVSPQCHGDLFRATCGGMGLTGLVVAATLRLLPIGSAYIRQQTIKSHDVRETLDLFQAHQDAPYSVAWLDCMASGRRLGRSVVMLGDHAPSGGLAYDPPRAITVRLDMPSALLNGYSIGAFNRLYYACAANRCSVVPYQPFFYPLDRLLHWNRLYGRNGFVQYQCVLPQAQGRDGMADILRRIAASGLGSFLAVLKACGPANDNPLSFPLRGYSLALDFRLTQETRHLFTTLDRMVLELGGRVYLTKDALLSANVFRGMYPQWEAFQAVRERYGAIGAFGSAQSGRLGL